MKDDSVTRRDFLDVDAAEYRLDEFFRAATPFRWADERDRGRSASLAP
ncbi:MAG: hypothetical protein IPF87_14845 [Gemmatimonadetes bacterium]|jgi:hypothetical protein|nr:hypothetical protein [Gemmatimonadota bacterium]